MAIDFPSNESNLDLTFYLSEPCKQLNKINKKEYEAISSVYDCLLITQ